MKKRFCIVMGRSGSGKGTQSLLLKSFLEEKGCSDVKHVTTGAGFRALNEGSSFTALSSKTLTESGGSGPNFLAVWNWTNIFINELNENTTIILDGAPRKLIEVEALFDALLFYGYEKPLVIYIDVSEAWAEERLISRERGDDTTKEKRDKKMKWFLEDVLPCVDYYAHNPYYHFVRINGERSIDEVSHSIKNEIEKLL
jgi:adenylate kinase family enzyme